MELAHGELPAAFLLSGMFAGNAVEPTLNPACEQEIVFVDGQNAAFHENSVEQPVRKRQGHACCLAGFLIRYFGPAFQPVKRRRFFLALGADIGANRRVREPVERGAEAQVMLAAGRSANSLEHTVWVEG